jgi:hypothetical protein
MIPPVVGVKFIVKPDVLFEWLLITNQYEEDASRAKGGSNAPSYAPAVYVWLV